MGQVCCCAFRVLLWSVVVQSARLLRGSACWEVHVSLCCQGLKASACSEGGGHKPQEGLLMQPPCCRRHWTCSAAEAEDGTDGVTCQLCIDHHSTRGRDRQGKRILCHAGRPRQHAARHAKSRLVLCVASPSCAACRGCPDYCRYVETSD